MHLLRIAPQMNECVCPAVRADEGKVDASSRAPSTSTQSMCLPTMSSCHSHEQVHAFFSRTEHVVQGRALIPYTLHGRALKHKVPLIMNSMHLIWLRLQRWLAQALGPGNPGAPAQHIQQ